MRGLSIVIPFYNEERTIPKLVQLLIELHSDIRNEIIFVNDGSTDSSLDLLETELLRHRLEARIINKINGGKASAIRAAIPYINCSHTIIFDADLELSTSDILKLWQISAESSHDYIFGYRAFRSQSSFTYRYVLGNKIISHLYGILFNEVITDIMCGLKLFPSSFLRQIPFKFTKFAVEIELVVWMWKQNLKPIEVEVNYSPRTVAEGKVIGMRDAIQIVSLLIFLRVRYWRN